MAQVAAVAQVQSLAWELPRAIGVAKKKKNCPLGIFHLRFFSLVDEEALNYWQLLPPAICSAFPVFSYFS